MKRVFLILLTLVLFTNNISSQSFKGYKTLKTEHFDFVYEPLSKEFVPLYARYAEEAYKKIAKYYSIPDEKIPVYITDRTNIVNAFTYSFPNSIMMFTTPVMTNDFTFRENWMKAFITHELIHSANFSFEDKDKALSKIFGGGISSLDFSDYPTWALEGLAVTLETEFTNGGRGRSPYFELYYKAAALEGSFVDYYDIGTEYIPPDGQAYIFGYLIMESIKERFGIEALAAIERNRKDGRDVEEAIEFVTGFSAKEIYEDAKRSLVKRYTKERSISEGKTISDKNNNVYFYKPAIVFNDGSFITYRRKKNNSGEVIRFCPEKKEGLTFPKDKHKDYNKDILFVANVCDEFSITADKKLNVYAASQDVYRNKLPGASSIIRIYKWDKKRELKPLTTGSKSYFQPSVSQDGSTLIACTQNKTKMQLERIDTQSGDSTVILSNPAYDFIQPSVNSDGTKVTFLAVSDTQAKIGYINIDKDFKAKPQSEFIIVESAEDKNKIYDISLPTFTKENTITFCSNKRGRLEVFETEKIETEKKSYEYKCVVSDPVGALWANKNKNGIYYMSYSSTGNVIKIKPEDEWGKVAAFEGPSKSGEIIPVTENFDDYKAFNPFEKKLDEKIIKREDQFIKKAEEIQNQEIKTVSLGNEKIFFPLPSNLLRLPLINVIGEGEETHAGFGAMLIYKYPNINYQENYLLFDFLYYPTINQLEGNFSHVFYNYSFMTFLLLNRELFRKEESAEPFTETNTLLASIKLPFVNETKINSSYELSLISHTGIYFEKASSTIFAINDDLPYNKNYYASIGLDYYYEVESKLLNYKKLSAQALFQYIYNETKQTNEFGIEGEIEFDCDISDLTNSINLRANYSNFSSILPTAITRMNVAGKNISTEMPYNIILQESLLFYNFLYLGLDFKPYYLAQFSTDAQILEYKFYTGFETGLSMRQDFIRLGLSISLEENSEINFYITTKIGSLRN